MLCIFSFSVCWAAGLVDSVSCAFLQTRVCVHSCQIPHLIYLFWTPVNSSSLHVCVGASAAGSHNTPTIYYSSVLDRYTVSRRQRRKKGKERSPKSCRGTAVLYSSIDHRGNRSLFPEGPISLTLGKCRR